jgi:hypothetical protein
MAVQTRVEELKQGCRSASEIDLVVDEVDDAFGQGLLLESTARYR